MIFCRIVEPMNVSQINELARRYGTPLFVYEGRKIKEHLGILQKTFKPVKGEIFYAMKANPRLAILRSFRKAGVGIEAVSWGEVRTALGAGYKGRDILFNGNGKTESEVDSAVQQGVEWFNFDALDQLDILEWVAKKHKRKLYALLRAKPEIKSVTHPHLAVGERGSKFGFLRGEIPEILRYAKKLKYALLSGLHTHFGSQILNVAPFLQAARFSRDLFEEIRQEGFPMEMLDLGGGFGIPYAEKDTSLDFKALTEGYREVLAGFRGRVVFEPGRFLVGSAGVLLTRVVSVKRGPGGDFLVLDAGMTENIRPALYGARHRIVSIDDARLMIDYTVVGPVCENSDCFGNFKLPEMRRGDLVLILDSGAYGSSMGSIYNSRPRPAEVLVLDGKLSLIRKRDSLPSLWMGET
ncbi:MAG: diaminopimelate decarboxylase [Elusimicrobia bacterium]|nr:diaminopimelate decarboxylase [Elusimicrobiota bacterium]